MAERDPAFLFYSADAAEDVSHMNRTERGCYFDLIQAQRKFHGITTEQARKILGKDFDSCWPALEMILKKDGDTFFIEWMRTSLTKRAEFKKIQKNRIQKYWDEKKQSQSFHGTSTEVPMVNEIENGNGIVNKNKNATGNFKPPEKNEVAAYMGEIDYPGIVQEEAENFINFYESKGWMIGKNKMKSWQAAVRTWKKNRNNDDTGNSKTGRTGGYNNTSDLARNATNNDLLAEVIRQNQSAQNGAQNRD